MIETIDLDRHGVIEASAGTGKTYTLEKLVLRLLRERQVSLEQILLVTFTEKATGELKGRLRLALESECAQSSPQRERFQAALDSFDQAPIFTIHGFCQRALQEYALENRHELRMQLADDRELLETCLREIQRKNWREAYGVRLREVLELAGYSSSAGGGERWEALVRQIALRLRPCCAHQLRPELLGDWPAVLWQREQGVLESLRRWRRLAGPCAADNVQAHCWSTGFRQLEDSARTLESRHNKLLVPLLNMLADLTVDRQPLFALQRFFHDSQGVSSFEKYGFHLLTENLGPKAQAEIDRLCPNLREVVNELEQLRQDRALNELKHQLAIRTIRELQTHLSAYKSERGLQSFEDMLTRLEASLDPLQSPQAGVLCARLRERFHYAIVDEFQDTDPLQWRIFKRLFVEGTHKHALFIVGDPKQAIFGFRGADVHAYLTARNDLKENFSGVSYPLDVNWRSCPELIGALNGLFEESGWFSKTGIPFRCVRPPKAAEQRYLIDADRTGRPALCCMDLSEEKNLVPARRRYAHFIAAEIRRLLGNSDGAPAMQVQQKGEQAARPLNASDCCVLVTKRDEAKPVLAALHEYKIPYSFYKQTGLWQSDEAIHLDYLLRALARPDDTQAFHKALLTRFYRIRPEQLSACEQLPPGHEARRLFDRWVELAEQRDWAQLFRSVLDDTGVLLHDLEKPDGERRLANFRQILQTLQQAAYAQDLDLLGVLELLHERRRFGAEDDSDLQPIETEQPKVKIMTIHASKGLEFPVVFLAGGFARGRPGGCITYRDSDKKLIFDLCPGEEAAALAEAERDHEDRRLLYVALTRAIFKLYVPRLDPEKKYQMRGPLATILAPALEAARLETIPCPPFHPGPLSSAIEEEPSSAQAKPDMVEAPGELFPKLPADLSRRRIVIRSFSSLHRASGFATVEGPTFGEAPPRPTDEGPDVLPAEETVRGTGFGSLVHDVLQRIRFEEVGAAATPDNLLTDGTETRSLIDGRVEWYLPELSSRLRGDELRSACRRQVAQLVWNTLHTPLQETGVPLWQIPEQDRLQELEFHFPEWDGPSPAEVARSEGFYTGFIDLVFRKNGRYFLVDWKSNALPAYKPQDIAKSMRESDYHRQYRLYLHALARWFKRAHGGAFDFARQFGGVYYLYLRGMNAKDETTGVFFYRPTGNDLQLDRAIEIRA